jgi:putative flippase GtrA
MVTYPSMTTLNQTIKFIFVGIISTTIHFTFLILLVEYIKLNSYYANLIAFLFAIGVSYFGNKNFVFRYKGKKNNVFLFTTFTTSSLLGLFLNNGLFFITQYFFNFHYILSFLTASGITAIVIFLINKKVIFS